MNSVVTCDWIKLAYKHSLLLKDEVQSDEYTELV